MTPPRISLAAVLIAALYAAPGAAHAADAPRIAPADTLLTLNAEGKSTRAPDIASITAGVASTGATAGEAMAANARAMNRVITALTAAGIADRDIQTSNLNLQPAYANRGPNDDSQPRITGYTARNQVSVRDRDLPHLGKVLDALVSAGANQIDGPSFGVDKPDAAMDEARTAAVATARARADLYARAAGLHVLRIVAISESGGYNGPQPVFAARAMAMDMARPTPVAAGEVAISANVNVEFELAP